MSVEAIKRRLKGIILQMPGMISCQEFEDFIVDYLEDGLTPKQRRLFDAHLLICRECREYLNAYKASLDTVKRALEEPSTPDPVDTDVADEVLEELIGAVIASRNTVP